MMDSDYPSSPNSGYGSKKKVNKRLYKTNLCRTYARIGTCPYGKKCQFAHGEDELQPIPADLQQEVAAVYSPPAIGSSFGGGAESFPGTPRAPANSMATPVIPLSSISLSGLAPMNTDSAASPKVISVFNIAALNAGVNSPKLQSPMLTQDSPRLLGGAPDAVSSPRVARLKLNLLLDSAGKSESPAARLVDHDRPVQSLGISTGNTVQTEDSTEVSQHENAPTDQDLFKTELCRSFSRSGYCKYGDSCQFAHGLDELRPLPIMPQINKKFLLSNGESGSSKGLLAVLRSSTDSPTNRNGTRTNNVENIEETAAPGTVSRSPARLSPLVMDPPSGFKASQEPEIMPIDIDEVGRVTPISTRSPGVMEGLSPYAKDPRVYKTEMCKKFELTGDCPYGLKCQFAHGVQELRQRLETPSAETATPAAIRNTPVNTPVESSPRKSPTKHDPRLFKTELCRSFTKSGYCRYGLKCQFAHGLHELRPKLVFTELDSDGFVAHGEFSPENVRNDVPLAQSPRDKKITTTSIIGPTTPRKKRQGAFNEDNITVEQDAPPAAKRSNVSEMLAISTHVSPPISPKASTTA